MTIQETGHAGEEPAAHMLDGLRVVEFADETTEYCGLLLAGLGAEVIKIEPPGGNATRRIGPFKGDDPGPENSLYFWQYNRGKRSIILDLDAPDDAGQLRELLRRSDVFLESTPKGFLDERDIATAAFQEDLPHLVHARMTPFGDDGPWEGFQGTDLIHLALGGPVMNCGYDPRPDGTYELPPFAPAMWHAYHIAGEQLFMGIVAANMHRATTGQGQTVACAIHEAVAKCTESDLMGWVMRRVPFQRQTGRHAGESVSELSAIGNTKDGRWVMTRGPARHSLWARLPEWLEGHGMSVPTGDTLPHDDEGDQAGRLIPGSRPIASRSDEAVDRATELMHRLVRKYTFTDVPWIDAQEAGFLWAPLRKPHENLADDHWHARRTFAAIDHPELGREIVYAASKWRASETSWSVGGAAPTVGADDRRRAQILSEPVRTESLAATTQETSQQKRSALENVKVLDFTWFLASGGATRFLSAFGAEVLKVEWKENPDTRLGAMAPEGGRAARDKATGPLPGVTNPNMGGQFNNKHPGKYGISLNIRHPHGLEIAKELARGSDVFADGFSPGVMQRLGLGYDVLRSEREDIIYCQQSGLGAEGTYGTIRTVGPVAQAIAGMSEMCGLPEPAMPVGWGYSYLDWMGAYSFASAIMSAIYYRHRTGKGQAIDASQVEVGIFLSGTALLDWQVNGREWQRFGNRPPYVPAAPQGIYRCAGEDRWIAIACLDEGHWAALIRVLGDPPWSNDPSYVKLEGRLAQQDALDGLINGITKHWDAYELMDALQAQGVPAGVCQTAADRVDRDPQLRHLEWMTELTGTEIGTWPIPNVPVDLTRSPSDIGGRTGRAAPCYGEHNRLIYEERLGLTQKEIDGLMREGII